MFKIVSFVKFVAIAVKAIMLAFGADDRSSWSRP